MPFLDRNILKDNIAPFVKKTHKYQVLERVSNWRTKTKTQQNIEDKYFQSLISKKEPERTTSYRTLSQVYCKTFVIKPLVINSAHRLSVKTSIFFRINCFALAAWDFLPDTNILNIEILISKMQYRIKLKVLALTKRITHL